MSNIVTLLSYVGLGSNLGDRGRYLEAATAELRHAGLHLLALSSVYESSPVGSVPDQPAFLNAVAKVSGLLSVGETLSACLSIETRLGRVRHIKEGPRTLDLDLLLARRVAGATDESVGWIRCEGSPPGATSEALELPHPRLGERAFVLRPLLEIEPGFALWIQPQLDRLGNSQPLAHRGCLTRLLRDGAPGALPREKISVEKISVERISSERPLCG